MREHLEAAIAELTAEREHVTAAIVVIESIVGARGRGAAAAPDPSRPRQKSGRGWTTAQREVAARRMKRYWAKRRKARA